MTDQKTGWLRDDEDRAYLRTQGIIFNPPQSFGAPEEFDTRPIIAVENQANTSSCVGHATSSCIEACAWIAAQLAGDAMPDQYSRWFAYLAAQKQSGMLGSDQGATISGAAEAMKLGGCCHETTLPFPGRYVKTIPAAATAEAGQFKIRTHTSLPTYQRVFDFMAGGFGGVVIGIAATNRFMNCTGVLELSDVKGQGGGHALLLWGHTKRVDAQGRHYVWLHNSWGKSWGNGGRAEVAPEAIDYWGRSQNNELIGLSDLSGLDVGRKIDFSAIV